MAPPSPLAIATSSLQRLVKEEASYYKELEKQEARLKKIEASTEEDENREYTLKQEVRLYCTLSIQYSLPSPSILKTAIHGRTRIATRETVQQGINDITTQRAAIEETKAVFPTLQVRITDNLEKLRDQIEKALENPGEKTEEEVVKAKSAIEGAEAALKAAAAKV